MKIQKETLSLYSISEEGLISSDNVGEGRLIPVLVIDVLGDKDIEDLIKLHESITSGDVAMTWSQDFFNRDYFILKMEFIKPMELVFGIKFRIETEFPLIDGIIESKGYYLQTGTKGDKILKKIGDSKILIEVPDMGVKKIWNKILARTIEKKYRKKGFSKKESINITKQQIIEMRKFWKMRR